MTKLSEKRYRFLLAIPCWRESERLGNFLGPLCELLGREELGVRVLVVEDGSGGEEARRTAGIVADYRVRYPFLAEPLLLPENRGKGGAVYAAWERWEGEEWLGFADADGATPAREVVRLVRAIVEAEGRGDCADGWLGSRVKMLGREVRRTMRRHVVGRVYATLTSLLTGICVYDSQCGCKFYRAELVREVLPKLEERRFGFDVELIAWLLAGGARLVEFPIDWVDVPGSKVHLVQDSVRMFLALLRLRGRLRGRGGARRREW